MNPISRMLFGVCLALAMVACGSETLTTPTQQQEVMTQTPASQSTTPTPAPSPTPTPDPVRDKGPVSVVCGAGGQCVFSNTADSVRGVLALCTYPLLRNDWGSLGIDVPPGKNTAKVTPYEICDMKKMGIPEIRCTDVNKKVQLDFEFRSNHIGHWMPDLVYKANPEDAWKPIDPVVTSSTEYGEWGQCHQVAVSSRTQECTQEVDGVQDRTVTLVVVTQNREQNSCTQEIRNAGEPITVRTPQAPESKACKLNISVPCPPPPDPGTCYYNNNHWDGKIRCMALPGYVSWNSHNHLCELKFPGISDRDFQLNPGQSAPGCLDKRD